jgi:hypothetical protein
MADPVHVPHHLGVIVGSRVLRPWLADDAQQAIDAPWRGQPAFTSAADAYAWLYWARTQPWLPDGLSIARTDVRISESVNGLRRVQVGQSQLRDPDHQVLRTHPAGVGPDEQALAASFGMARSAAARTWLIDQVGADARTRIDAVVQSVWEYGSLLAAGDARLALAGHVQRSVRAVQAAMFATTTGRPSGPAWTYLQRLDQAAAAIVDAPAPTRLLDLDKATLEQFRAQMREGGALGAWDDVLAAVWKHALRTAVLDAIGTAVQDLTAATQTATTSRAAKPRIDGQPAAQWLKIILNDANRAVAVGWLFATARLAPPPPPRPDAADPPLLPTPDNDDQPDDNTAVDASPGNEAEPSAPMAAVPESGSRPGRAFPLVPVLTDPAPTPLASSTGSSEQPPVAGPIGRHR